MKVVYLVPDIFDAPGGIARHSRLVAKALCESPALERLDILALWDDPSSLPDPHYLSGNRFSYRPFGGDRRNFVRAAITSLLRRRYDVLLSAHVSFGPLLFAPIPWHLAGRRIAFVHGLDAWKPLPWHKRWPLQHLDTVIAVSHYTARRVELTQHLEASRLRVIHNCLDPNLRPKSVPISPGPRPQTWPIVSGPVLVTVSQLLPAEAGKGHETVLRALPAVLERVPDLHYFVIGQGDRRIELEHLARQLGVSDRAHFLGSISDDDLGRILDMSQIYVMPSKYEGFGFVYLEAMAHGLPIIAGNRDASVEVVGDDGGILVDPDDPTQVAAAILRLLSRPELRCQFAESGRRRLQTMFSYDQFKAALLSLLSTR